MRVLHVAEAFGGGLLEMVRFVAIAATTEDDLELTVAVGRRPETPEDVAEGFPPDVAVVRLADWGDRRAAAQVRAARALRRLIATWRPDVVHVHSSFAGVLGAITISGVPVVLTPHSYASQLSTRSTPARAVFSLAERFATRRATVVGAVSASEAAIARSFGARDVRYIPNGIPELDDPLPLRGPKADPPVVVAAGRIVGQRRPDACARILAPLRGDADLVWIGGGGEDNDWARSCRDQLRRAGVPLTGWLPRDEALRLLGSATAYLHWTAWDGLALSLLEAMACDTIVVASDVGPNREVVGPRQLCRTEAEATTLLRRILADPGFAADVLDEQRERAAGFGAARMSAAWLTLYRELAAVGP